MVGEFGQPSSQPNILFISVITCSNKDQFSVKEAKNLLADYIAFPDASEATLEHFSVPIEDGKSKAAFLKFCKEKYTRRRESFIEIELQGVSPTSELIDLKVTKQDGKFYLRALEKY